MDVLAPILGTVMQLALFGVIVWAVVRLLGQRREDGEGAEVDRATSVRRVFVYGLMLVTLILTAVGATMIGQTLLTTGWSDGERTALALGLAFTLVAGPVYTLLLRFACGRLRDDVGERTSLAWAAYLERRARLVVDRVDRDGPSVPRGSLRRRRFRVAGHRTGGRVGCGVDDALVLAAALRWPPR